MENIPIPEGPGSLVCSEVAMVAQDRELRTPPTPFLFLIAIFERLKPGDEGRGNEKTFR